LSFPNLALFTSLIACVKMREKSQITDESSTPCLSIFVLSPMTSMK
jgi:hypothetical protein